MTILSTKYEKGGHSMSYTDKSIQCSDCNTNFTFSADEQEQFASRGYTNEPKRCPACRQARKAQQNGGSSFSNNSGYAPRREMFPAKCAECGKDTQVPFEPRSGRPVYCSDCYRKVKPSR
jgi:CxxC-x17-CxxC domain-containing protein